MESTKIMRPLLVATLNYITHRHTCKQKLLVITSIRILILLLSALAFTQLPAQKIWEERKGCIRAQGNLAPGYLFSQKIASGYVAGDMDLFFDNRVSFTGAAWYSFALNRKNETGLKANHALFAGLNYHFLKPGRFDPYIGFTPGIGLVQATYEENDELRKSKLAVLPLVSASIGFNYYVGWIFHVFVKVQGVTGQVSGTLPAPVRVDELKCMAGLGWNLRIWKPKHKDTYMPVMLDRNR
ncbi:MAG TPA: hypothetical protein VK154_05090 [Chitinophagales bacterium]|nr:hypothetical protein [Chitinophagales bacterium]